MPPKRRGILAEEEERGSKSALRAASAEAGGTEMHKSLEGCLCCGQKLLTWVDNEPVTIPVLKRLSIYAFRYSSPITEVLQPETGPLS